VEDGLAAPPLNLQAARVWYMPRARLQKMQGSQHARVDTSTATFRLSQLESDAVHTVVEASQQTHVKLLPNHHMNEGLELAGFHFTCNASDSASVMPIPKTLFACTAMYEVRAADEACFNTSVLRLLSDRDAGRASLASLVAAMSATDCEHAPSFECMQDDDELEAIEGVMSFLAHDRSDRRVWTEQMPSKVGVYHAFVRKNTKDRIEHKLFIVVSGSLPFVDDEMYRLWQDSCTNTTCAQFVCAEETQWLRAATVRNHNRVAALVSEALQLPLTCMIDTEDPTKTRRAAHPTTVTFQHDIYLDSSRNAVHVVNSGCFLDKSQNGVLFEMHAGEGFWLFPGPTDNASGYSYGTVFNSSVPGSCFPTTTVRYHEKFAGRGAVVSSVRGANPALLCADDDCDEHVSLFPEEAFLKRCEALGFNRNSPVISLMPVLAFVRKDML
jgi:hypothetical protein